MPNIYNLPETFEEDETTVKFPRMVIHRGMAGFKPVIYWWNPEGFPEPYESYPVAFSSSEDAIAVAEVWSVETGVSFRPPKRT